MLGEVAAAAYTIVSALDLAMGRGARRPWEGQPELYKLEQTSCVRAHLAGEYSCARDAHEDWSERRRQAGWTWGPLRDVERKYHPSLLPWRALPLDLTAKAELYRASVLTVARSFAEMYEAGIELARPGKKPSP